MHLWRRTDKDRASLYLGCANRSKFGLESVNHTKAIFANLLWGMVPAYYFLLDSIDPSRMTAYRFLFTFLWLFAVRLGSWKNFSLLLLRTSCVPALLLTVNAYIYLVAVLNGYVFEAAYGYLMTPILTIVFGWLLLNEKLSINQWTGSLIGLCSIVAYAIMTQTLPWFGFGIACPFAFYLIWHKVRRTSSSLEALHHESFIMLLLPCIYLAMTWNYSRPLAVAELTGALAPVIALSGLVAVAPLALYISAGTYLSTLSLGIYQFIAPIVAIIVAVILFGEQFTLAKAVVTSGLILGLALASLRSKRRR